MVIIFSKMIFPCLKHLVIKKNISNNDLTRTTWLGISSGISSCLEHSPRCELVYF